jgi:hypothetical protein
MPKKAVDAGPALVSSWYFFIRAYPRKVGRNQIQFISRRSEEKCRKSIIGRARTCFHTEFKMNTWSNR